WRMVNYQEDYYSGWRADAEKVLKTRNWRDLTPGVLIFTLPRLLFRAISLVLFLLFAIGLPILVVRDFFQQKDDRVLPALLASLYLYYWAVFGIHLLVNVEIRYLGPICFVPIIGALFVA